MTVVEKKSEIEDDAVLALVVMFAFDTAGAVMFTRNRQLSEFPD